MVLAMVPGKWSTSSKRFLGGLESLLLPGKHAPSKFHRQLALVYQPIKGGKGAKDFVSAGDLEAAHVQRAGAGVVDGDVLGGGLKQGTNVKTLLRRSRTSGDPPELVYMIEGRRVEPSRRLADGEDLKILHAAYGG